MVTTPIRPELRAALDKYAADVHAATEDATRARRFAAHNGLGTEAPDLLANLDAAIAKLRLAQDAAFAARG